MVKLLENACFHLTSNFRLLNFSLKLNDFHIVTKFFSPFFFRDKKGGKGKDPRNDSSDEEDSPQSGKIKDFIMGFFVISW